MSEQNKTPSRRPEVIALHIKERSALYAAYMPFCRHGGLFMPTDKAFQIGEEVFLLLTVLNEPEKFPIQGKVAWITPPHAAEKRLQGVGIAFSSSEADKKARLMIENLLSGSHNSTRQTHTM